MSQEIKQWFRNKCLDQSQDEFDSLWGLFGPFVLGDDHLLRVCNEIEADKLDARVERGEVTLHTDILPGGCVMFKHREKLVRIETVPQNGFTVYKAGPKLPQYIATIMHSEDGKIYSAYKQGDMTIVKEDK